MIADIGTDVYYWDVDESVEDDLFELIENGDRGPVEVVYLVAEEPDGSWDIWGGLNDISWWGDMTGWWNIRFVKTLGEALAELRSEPAEVIILFGASHADSKRIADEFPYLPQSLAQAGGFEGFPSGWPPQVVVAQWATPRETEFGDGLKTALSKPVTEIIYNIGRSDVSLLSAHNLELLSKLAEKPDDRFIVTPRFFEEAVATILANMGYEVELTPASGDKGRDVLARFNTPTGPILTLVECKRYAAHRPVSIEPVARLWTRLFEDRANLALAVTTSRFTPNAHEFAKTKGYQVSLADGAKFIEWIRSLKK